MPLIDDNDDWFEWQTLLVAVIVSDVVEGVVIFFGYLAV